MSLLYHVGRLLATPKKQYIGNEAAIATVTETAKSSVKQSGWQKAVRWAFLTSLHVGSAHFYIALFIFPPERLPED